MSHTLAETEPLVIGRWTNGQIEAARADVVAIESPLELRFGGRPATILMRTPGQDEDLVYGFLFNEGFIRAVDEVVTLATPTGLSEAERGNVLDVVFRDTRGKSTPDRLLVSSASCGVCGKRSLESLRFKADRIESAVGVSARGLCELPSRLRDAQPTFGRTGGVHASGLFTADGALLCVREDVGRHNALDKLIGWAVRERMVPLGEHILMLSGRVSFELIQKAVMAGIPIVAAVGAPSSLAISLAREYGVTLVGFTHADGFNIYSGGERIAQGA